MNKVCGRAFLAPSGSALDAGRLHTMCSTLVVTMFMSSTCSADIFDHQSAEVGGACRAVVLLLYAILQLIEAG